MLAIGTLLLIVALSLVVTRVATVILTATGTARHVARFQARSAFTGAGFTTSESERVVNHPLRRRVIATLMLLGNIGIVGAASTAILGLRGGAGGREAWRVFELVMGLLALVFLSRSRWVDQKLTAAIGHILHEHTDLPARDLSGLLKLSGEYAVQELGVGADDWIAGRSLGDLGLRDEGIVVLGITRSDGRYVGAPTGATSVAPGDNLVIYGRTERLRELDRRPSGVIGLVAHDAAVREQEQVQREQARIDTEDR